MYIPLASYNSVVVIDSHLILILVRSKNVVRVVWYLSYNNELKQRSELSAIS